MFYQNELAMRNTADVTVGNPIAIRSQSISGVNAVNPLVAFYDILGRERGAILFFFMTSIGRISKIKTLSIVFTQVLAT
jgi:hypothetical protein